VIGASMALLIAHFSDIHLSVPPRDIPWRDLLSKRIIGWANLRLLGRYSRLAAAPRITEALLGDLEETRPDHVVFTGDATGLSLPAEFREARRILAPLIDGDRITGIPGNHDFYVASAVRAGLYETHLGAWERAEISRPPLFARLLGEEAALICLRDARPSALHDSSGRIGEPQLASLREILRDPRVQPRRRIVALHYGPLRWDARPDTRLHGLEDGEELLEIVDAARVDLVIHGHIHSRFVLPRSPQRPVPIANPGSLTYSACERAYHLYRLSDSGLEIRVRRWDKAAAAFAPWPDAPGSGNV
ncbi:MAG: metallophosphoesterase, partial [Planctomycetes bacterium]|nr:metallophosphoesterase [Planctomycetota bacterium]